MCCRQSQKMNQNHSSGKNLSMRCAMLRIKLDSYHRSSDYCQGSDFECFHLMAHNHELGAGAIPKKEESKDR